MSKSKKASEKSHKLVDFDVISENWHVYELDDETVIRTKNVLMSIHDFGPASVEEAGAPGLRKLGFGLKLLNVIYSPTHLRGPKGKARLVSELEGFIVERNLKFRRIKDGGNCKYETGKSELIVRTRVTQVDKTSKFDQNGMPAYIVRIESEILTSPKPEKKRKN